MQPRVRPVVDLVVDVFRLVFVVVLLLLVVVVVQRRQIRLAQERVLLWPRWLAESQLRVQIRGRPRSQDRAVLRQGVVRRQELRVLRGPAGESMDVRPAHDGHSEVRTSGPRSRRVPLARSRARTYRVLRFFCPSRSPNSLDLSPDSIYLAC